MICILQLKQDLSLCISSLNRTMATHIYFKYVKIAINNERLKHFYVDCVAICQIKLENIWRDEIRLKANRLQAAYLLDPIFTQIGFDLSKTVASTIRYLR